MCACVYVSYANLTGPVPQSKVVLESKSKQEMEMISLRTELTKAEYDLTRQHEALRQAEAALKLSGDKLGQAERAAAEAAENSSRLRCAAWPGPVDERLWMMGSDE